MNRASFSPLPFELHTHSCHSDGHFSIGRLMEWAAESGYAGIALTDHNTLSGLPEAASAAAARGLIFVPGFEWTTFYGHILLLGSGPHIDWSQFGRADIGPAAAAARSAGYLLGAAHPFHPGNPFCTGCFWAFDPEWHLLDYIEVWNGGDPSAMPENCRAYHVWKQCLNRGIRIKALTGRDWHGDEAKKGGLRAAVFLELPLSAGSSPEASSAAVLEAVRTGVPIVSYGPLPFIESLAAGTDCSPHAAVRVHVGLKPDSGWGIVLDEVFEPVLLADSDRGVLMEKRIMKPCQEPIEYSFSAPGCRWLMAELHGSLSRTGPRQLLAFTNPIYLSEGS